MPSWLRSSYLSSEVLMANGYRKHSGQLLMDIIDVYKISYFRQHTTISDIFRQILLLHDSEKNVIICRLNKKKGGK